MAGITTLELPRMRFTVSDHPELISVELITQPRRPRRPRRVKDVLPVVGLLTVAVLGVGSTVALAILGLL